MTIKEDILAIVAEQPGLSASEIANCLARDPRNTRRDIAELKGRCELVTRKDGRGVDRYFLANGAAASVQEYALDYHRLERRQPEPRVIDDVPYRDVTPPRSLSTITSPPATGRALVVSQPADSRTEAALRQHARAKALALRSSQGRSMAGQVIDNLNQLYTADPDGLEALAALQRAEFARAEAERIERERARQASAMAQQQAVEPSMWDMGMRAAILGFDAYCSMGRQQAEARAARRQSSAAERAEPYEDYFARRQRAKREAEEVKPPSLLDRLRDRARTGTNPEGEAQPPVSDRPEPSWWRKHFGTPRRAVWR